MKTKEAILDFRFDLLFYSVTAVYFLYLLNVTSGFSPDAALTPKVTLTIGLLLCGVGLVKILFVPPKFVEGWNADPRTLTEELDEEQRDGESEEQPCDARFYAVTIFIYIISTIAFIFSIVVVGFFTSMFLFMFSHSYIRGKSALRSLAAAVLLPTLFYVIFIIILGRTLILRYGILF